MITIERWHDFCYGHRVYGHENKCGHLHGHNGRVHFTLAGKQDELGRVLDFSEVNKTLCDWIECNWDHKFLVWKKDPIVPTLLIADSTGVVQCAFNPTAENMAHYLLEKIGAQVLPDHVTLVKVKLEETRKCSATARKVM